MSTSVKTPIRSDSIYVSPSVSRWLTWISKLDENKHIPPDAIADQMLRDAILAKYPHIQGIVDAYWQKRRELDDQAIKDFKEQHKPGIN